VFVIEDERHSDWMGKFSTRAEAMLELRRLASLPWDDEPNRAPCTNWARCGRSYELVELEGPWHEVSRKLTLEISANGTRWL